MNWYYAEAGQQVGPVTEEELLRLADGGRIQADTLVWHEGLPNWQAYGHVRPRTPGTAPLPPSMSAAPPSEIGATLPVLPMQLPYAGFWIRLGAKIIDGIAVGMVLGIPAAIIMLMSLGQARSTPGAINLNVFTVMNLFWQFVSTVLMVIYNWFFLARFAATPGKMVCGLKVVTATGGPITSGQALGRSAAEILSKITCFIGYIIAAFDTEKRTLHDHIANTRVVFK